jgi:hypothetical protein
MLAVGVGFYGNGQGWFSSGGNPNENTDGAWKNSLVYYKLLSKNFHTGASVDPTFEIYGEEPESCWEQPRATTCDENYIGQYSSSSGAVTIQDLKPGKYYVIARLSAYYTEYAEIIIPDEPQTSVQSLADYNQAPESSVFQMENIDTSVSVENATLSTISTNVTKEMTIVKTLSVADDKCFRPWKLRIYENNDSLTDYDGSTTYEGIKTLKVALNGGSYKTVVELATGTTSGFNTDGASQFTEFDVSNQNILVCDGNGLELKVYIKADVTVDANLTTVENQNQELSANEIVAKMKIYDVMGNTIPTDYIYVQGASA